MFPFQVNFLNVKILGNRKQPEVFNLKSQVLEILGASYSYHMEEEETFDSSLLDLMETSVAGEKNPQILSDISNSPKFDKAIEDEIKKIEEAQMKTIKSGLHSKNFHFHCPVKSNRVILVCYVLLMLNIGLDCASSSAV